MHDSYCTTEYIRRSVDSTINATRATTLAGGEQVSGPRVAHGIVKPLQQRAIGTEFSCASPVLLWCVPGILCVSEPMASVHTVHDTKVNTLKRNQHVYRAQLLAHIHLSLIIKRMICH